MLQARTQLLALADGIGAVLVCSSGMVMPSRGNEQNPTVIAVGGGGTL